MNLLTKSNTFILGPIAVVLGLLMNGIFFLQEKIGIGNIGLCIILFTIVIYMALMPLTIRQQKFAKLTPLMQPELNAIQSKYKGKTDQASMQKMNDETQLVYAKYGVNPMGSCVQLLIQMPILFALYSVIMNVPAYVTAVKNVFVGLANTLLETAGAEDYLKGLASSIRATTISKEFTVNTIIDTLYKFRPTEWADMAKQFPDLTSQITSTQAAIDHYNFFLGLNIADTPMNIIRNHESVLVVILAVLVPVLAALSQWVSVKITSGNSNTQQTGSGDQMANQMKMMNNVMPLMSAFFCLTLPVGLGIYWIAGAVVRGVLTYFINKRLDSQDLEAMLAQNLEKNKKKIEKKGGVSGAQISRNAAINTRNIMVEQPAETSEAQRRKDLNAKASKISDSVGGKKKNAAPGSLASKANMVSDYNETHQKK